LAHKLRVHFAIASCGRLTAPDLQAMPKTPLWEKLEREGRLDTKQALESNARFLHPRREVVASWRRVIAYAYAPERVFARFRYQVDATYANRLRLRQRASSPGLTSNAAWRLPATSSAGSESCRTTEQRSGAQRGLRSAAVKSSQFLAWASSRGT
jgi:hypothetical protein